MSDHPIFTLLVGAAVVVSAIRAAKRAQWEEEQANKLAEEQRQANAKLAKQRQEEGEKKRREQKQRDKKLEDARKRYEVAQAEYNGQDVCNDCLTIEPQRCRCGHCYHCYGTCGSCGNCRACCSNSCD